jgi:16S rRNA (guanine1207-N2)-methyltransferase
MSRRRREKPLSKQRVPECVVGKVRSPLVVVLGSPAEVVNLLRGLPEVEATCYQLDLYQAERLEGELAEAGLRAKVATLPDLWDLPFDFQTAVYMPARGGERELKIDMVEQAFHVLKAHGALLVWSPYERDPFFPNLLKKVFGRIHTPPHAPPIGEQASIVWAQREGDRPRRRHEVTFQVKIHEGPSCRFLSRPGTFSYGRFDNGARALAEVMEVRPGDRVLDVGCGVGTNGVFAARQAGAAQGGPGFVCFVDSNVRALALAEHNARANGVTSFEVVASSGVEGPPENSFDVVLANPPYYANSAIAQLFVRRARQLLKPQGRFYLVTRQPEEVGEVVAGAFGRVEALIHRGYAILCA